MKMKSYKQAKKEALAEFQIEYLRDLLYWTNWNVSAAAKIAQISRKTIHRLIKKHNLKR